MEVGVLHGLVVSRQSQFLLSPLLTASMHFLKEVFVCEDGGVLLGNVLVVLVAESGHLLVEVGVLFFELVVELGDLLVLLVDGLLVTLLELLQRPQNFLVLRFLLVVFLNFFVQISFELLVFEEKLCLHVLHVAL